MPGWALAGPPALSLSLQHRSSGAWASLGGGAFGLKQCGKAPPLPAEGSLCSRGVFTIKPQSQRFCALDSSACLSPAVAGLPTPGWEEPTQLIP